MRARVLVPVLVSLVLALAATPATAQLLAPVKDAYAGAPLDAGKPAVETVKSRSPGGAVTVGTKSLLPDEGAGSPLPGTPGVSMFFAPAEARVDSRVDLGTRDPVLPPETYASVAEVMPPVKHTAQDALVGNLAYHAPAAAPDAAAAEHAATRVDSRAVETQPDSGSAGSLGNGLPLGSPASGDSDEDASGDDDTGVRTASAGTRASPDLTTSAKVAAAAAALGLLALVPWALYHRVTGHRLLDQGARKRMHEAVLERPGAGVSDLAAVAGVTYSTASYHLERLVAAGILVAHGRGARLAYYVNGAASPRERVLRPLAQNAEALRVLAAVRAAPGTHKAAVADALDVSVTTVNWHLKRLVEAGLVSASRDGRRACLTADEDAIARDLEPLLASGPRRASATRARTAPA